MYSMYVHTLTFPSILHPQHYCIESIKLPSVVVVAAAVLWMYVWCDVI